MTAQKFPKAAETLVATRRRTPLMLLENQYAASPSSLRAHSSSIALEALLKNFGHSIVEIQNHLAEKAIGPGDYVVSNARESTCDSTYTTGESSRWH